MLFSGPVLLADYEIWFMRVLFAVVLYQSAILKTVPFVAQPKPVGLARFFDLTFLSNDALYQWLRRIAYLCLVLYAAGIALPVVTLYLALLSIATFSLRNSQGAIVHAKQLMSMILAVQAILYGFQTFNRFFNPTFAFAHGASYDQLAVYWTQQVIVAVYLTAALSKMWRSRFMWVRDAARVPLQMVKTAEQRYHNELDPQHKGRAFEMAHLMMRYPMATRAFMSGGLFLEMLSPLALMNRTTMIAGGILFIAFHKMNTYVMNLHFTETQKLIAIYFVNVPYLVVTGWSLLR
ncbi:MAG: hypothetical protein ACPGWR_01520 [Ardenticatenaceae bacterium]